MAPSYAYGARTFPKIPANSSLVIDIEVAAITAEPWSREKLDDELLIKEISMLSEEGDELVKRGLLQEAQVKF